MTATIDMPATLHTPPTGPGRHRDAEKIQPGWQVWNPQTGEWLTVEMRTDHPDGATVYTCEERDDRNRPIRYQVNTTSTPWSRSDVEQRQAAQWGGDR
ncbi:hypothetical protein [Nonomuraea basaltis]|uniref:hypothetical protein n=1 Tax=Nonomuraea basaltis TaxID=2495887 RepID=UPI00110C608A|nr:hypothetical protein [Nonomuraea basaltis]TMR91283.1 hypothetical protein EJK15_50725 [Nonomuraea basaltis]